MIILNTFANKVLLLRPCLHVVGYLGLVGKFLLFFVLQIVTQIKKEVRI